MYIFGYMCIHVSTRYSCVYMRRDDIHVSTCVYKIFMCLHLSTRYPRVYMCHDIHVSTCVTVSTCLHVSTQYPCVHMRLQYPWVTRVYMCPRYPCTYLHTRVYMCLHDIHVSDIRICTSHDAAGSTLRCVLETQLHIYTHMYTYIYYCMIYKHIYICIHTCRLYPHLHESCCFSEARCAEFWKYNWLRHTKKKKLDIHTYGHVSNTKEYKYNWQQSMRYTYTMCILLTPIWHLFVHVHNVTYI